MSSLIDLFNSKPFLYYICSSSHPYEPKYAIENALDKSTKWFQSNTSPYYWQITFSKPVKIKSYIMGGSTLWTVTPTSWEISYSSNGKTFSYLQTDSASTLKGTKKEFKLDHMISCVHFRITGKTCNNGNIWIALNQFDCFGSLRNGINYCTNMSGGIVDILLSLHKRLISPTT